MPAGKCGRLDGNDLYGRQVQSICIKTLKDETSNISKAFPIDSKDLTPTSDPDLHLYRCCFRLPVTEVSNAYGN